MKTKLTICGYLGTKSETTGRYEIAKPILRSCYDYIQSKGIQELNIKGLDFITATEEFSSGLLAKKLASQFSIGCKIQAIDWNASPDKSESARLRNVASLEGADKVILLRKGGSFGGQSLVDSIADKAGMDVLVLDIEELTGFVCKSETIKDFVKSGTKGTPKVLDFRGISQHYLDNGYLVCDTETSALGSEAEVIQISFVEIKTGICLFDTTLKPKGPVSESATAVNGLTTDMLQNSPTFEDVFPVIDTLIRNIGIVFYNAPFDYTQIKQEYNRLDKKIPVLRFEDAMPLVTSLFGEKMKLIAACEKLGIKPGTHSAISDCISLAEVIKFMAAKEPDAKT